MIVPFIIIDNYDMPFKIFYSDDAKEKDENKMILNLQRKRFNGKCTENHYIINVIKITNYSGPYIKKTRSTGEIIYNDVTAECVAIRIMDREFIICKVQSVENGLIRYTDENGVIKGLVNTVGSDHFNKHLELKNIKVGSMLPIMMTKSIYKTMSPNIMTEGHILTPDLVVNTKVPGKFLINGPIELSESLKNMITSIKGIKKLLEKKDNKKILKQFDQAQTEKKGGKVKLIDILNLPKSLSGVVRMGSKASFLGTTFEYIQLGTEDLKKAGKTNNDNQNRILGRYLNAYLRWWVGMSGILANKKEIPAKYLKIWS